MFSHLVWMNDLSVRADACIGPVVSLAKLGGARVTVAHALGRAVGTGEPYRAEVEAHLVGLVAALAARGVTATAAVEPGAPDEAAAALAGQRGADLVVAGSSGVSGLDRLLVGSNTKRLVRRASVPVLIVGPRAFERIDDLLCPVDADHDGAIALAATLARATGAGLTFFTVLAAGTSPSEAQEAERSVRERATRISGAPLPRAWRVRAVGHPSISEAIQHAAITHDVVVMGMGGQSGLERLLGGRVAEHVVRHCPASVLVAR